MFAPFEKDGDAILIHHHDHFIQEKVVMRFRHLPDDGAEVETFIFRPYPRSLDTYSTFYLYIIRLALGSSLYIRWAWR